MVSFEPAEHRMTQKELIGPFRLRVLRFAGYAFGVAPDEISAFAAAAYTATLAPMHRWKSTQRSLGSSCECPPIAAHHAAGKLCS
jgi:hypothetical protein